jgi:hypothetical protein
VSSSGAQASLLRCCFRGVSSAERPNGFGSKDAKKRDEFLNFVRSQQYREQLRSEMKTTQKLGSTLRSVGTSIASPERDGSAPMAADAVPSSPVNARATGSLSLSESVSSLSRTRDFAGRTGFDRAHDPRSPRTVYGIRERSSPMGKIDLGGSSLTSGEVGDGVDDVKLSAPQARKVSVVREFFRSNGGW